MLQWDLGTYMSTYSEQGRENSRIWLRGETLFWSMIFPPTTKQLALLVLTSGVTGVKGESSPR
jgi:hypothetical protein